MQAHRCVHRQSVRVLEQHSRLVRVIAVPIRSGKTPAGAVLLGQTAQTAAGCLLQAQSHKNPAGAGPVPKPWHNRAVCVRVLG